MSNANNHSFDFGEAGEDETIAALHRRRDRADRPAGPRSRSSAAGGLKVAFARLRPLLQHRLADRPGRGRGADPPRRRGAPTSSSSPIHAGAEGTDARTSTGDEETYLGEDRGNAEEFAHMAVEAGADLILGSGPHVLRGMEIYRGRLIAYSLGNFSGFHNFSLEGALGETVVLHVDPRPATAPSAPAGWPRCAWSKRGSRSPTPKAPAPRWSPSSRAKTSGRGR